ncbi:MAG: hypothetical protein BZ151_12055 [Desulfobacca sp. 4484_104]|nr:MAG: hypothetical protein BZ151_12055 [Desulfobacca sp. 4484_104]
MFISEKPATIFLPSHKDYYVLHDQDGDVWMFREQLDNWRYPRYTLAGKTLSRGIGHRASLDCDFMCDSHDNRISVLIEYLVTTKPGKDLDVWMFNQFLHWLRGIGGSLRFDEVRVNFNPGNTQQIQSFFSQFSFQRRLLPSGIEKIFCPVERLHLVVIADLKELDFQEIVEDWYAAKFGAA